MRSLVALCCVLLLTACGRDEPDVVEPRVDPPRDGHTQEPLDVSPPQQNPTVEAEDKRFHAALLAAAKAYPDYGNVDDLMRWAPGMCRVPAVRIRASASEDEGTHGRKLYWLYAKHRDAYMEARKGAQQPVGQVLVKEAFVAQAGRAPDDGTGRLGRQPVFTTVERDGEPYHAGDREALYVLLKLDPETAGTDEGWVYGTVTPDGKTVTSAGKVASCMGCHTENTTDRMFGLPAR